MRRCFRFTVLVFVMFVLQLAPEGLAQVTDAPSDASYESAKILQVERRVQRDPRMWVFDTPVVFTEIETYRMQLQVDRFTIIADYTPQVQPGYFPKNWVPESEVQVRTEGRKMFLRLPGNGDLELPADIIKSAVK